ncbi:MAG: hypothetical protein SGI97_07845 [candidate division Zixibacteria bacterium]|nr:hypothetical protein [candidate division Zixibacteria bacterium]
MSVNIRQFQIAERGNFGTIALGVAVVGVIGCIAGYVMDHDRFFHAYLTGFAYWVSLCLGALFFTMLQHLTGAHWSVVVRRISETLMACLPVMFLLSIPMFLGIHSLYHWSHEDAVATDALLKWKSPFLNSPFFIARTIVYFLIWSTLSYFLHKTSLEQDRGFKEDQLIRLRRLSAGGMVLFAVTITVAAFDWLMSLNPHWYSTIYGVYFFSGSFLGSLALITAIALRLRSRNILKDTITVEHYHDLGKLLFAFTVFWTYIGFSQFFIIWYGNIPEETIWYISRWNNGWKGVSLVIIFGHFVFPFLVMLFRAVKRSYIMLTVMTTWYLIMHWVDLYWLVYPNHYDSGPVFSWIEIMPMLAIGGIVLWFFWTKYSRNALVPVNDPKLEQSLHFVNH